MAERMALEPKLLATDDDLWTRAHSLFHDKEIVDLGFCIACWMGLGRMTHVLGLDDLCGLPSSSAATVAYPGEIKCERANVAHVFLQSSYKPRLPTRMPFDMPAARVAQGERRPNSNSR